MAGAGLPGYRAKKYSPVHARATRLPSRAVLVRMARVNTPDRASAAVPASVPASGRPGLEDHARRQPDQVADDAEVVGGHRPTGNRPTREPPAECELSGPDG